ncbi:lecithin retinol acyltransferase family protein [Helicobacter mehlei]|uniref:lecithin retinol acyltransferase family protein n=1 Tax=Helicobacter mehlei TaxID=2316080 RepID=UPI000EAEC047|nr:lecithin retinol acyltransferase family protein [Helicobacter mehlei]
MLPFILAPLAGFVGAAVVDAFYEVFLDDFDTYRDGTPVKPVRGSIVWHDMFNLAHTGIYVGNGEVVHLTGKTSTSSIEKEPFDKFAPGWTILVSSKGTSAVGCERAAAYAEKCVGEKRDYNLFKHNCHGFIVECLTGIKQDEVRTRKPSKEVAKHIGMDCWRRLDK